MAKEVLNPLENSQMQVKKACDALGLHPDVYEILKEPQRVIEVNIPVRMDDGSMKVFKGFRASHNDAVAVSYTHLDVYKRQASWRRSPVLEERPTL